jgi:hypothetical protein
MPNSCVTVRSSGWKSTADANDVISGAVRIEGLGVRGSSAPVRSTMLPKARGTPAARGVRLTVAPSRRKRGASSAPMGAGSRSESATAVTVPS